MYIYIYRCIYMYTYIFIHVYIYIYIYIYICKYTKRNIYAYVWWIVYIYVYMYTFCDARHAGLYSCTNSIDHFRSFTCCIFRAAEAPLFVSCTGVFIVFLFCVRYTYKYIHNAIMQTHMYICINRYLVPAQYKKHQKHPSCTCHRRAPICVHVFVCVARACISYISYIYIFSYLHICIHLGICMHIYIHTYTLFIIHTNIHATYTHWCLLSLLCQHFTFTSHGNV